MNDGKNRSKQLKELQEAWAGWLGDQAWSHWVTLTFKNPSSPDLARRAFLRWIRRLEQTAGVRVPWFVGFEDGELHGRLHAHALIANTEALAIGEMKALWELGFSHIARYDPERGAAHYITKYVTKTLLEYDISASLERAISSRGNQPSLPGLGITPSASGEKDV